MTTACSSPSGGQLHDQQPSPDLTTAALHTHFAMAAPAAEYKDRQFLAVIGDEVCIWRKLGVRMGKANGWQDTCTGMLLAGVGVCYCFLRRRDRRPD